MSRPQFTALDIETGSADDLYARMPDPSYVRLTGVGDTAYGGTGHLRPDGSRVPYVTVSGHFFDFPALDRHCGIPVEETVPYSRDLRVAAFQHDPPTTYETKSGPGFKRYTMDALAARYLGESKSDLGQELAKEYGGWDAIPVDDPRFSAYLREDLRITSALDRAVPWDPYEQREAWVCTATARATLEGMRVDVDGLTARARDLAQRAEDGRRLLAERYGFPELNGAGKLASAPQRTREGKQAFERALTSLGVDVVSWPRGKDGSLSLGKEVLATVAGALTGHPALAVVEAVQTMNGIRNNAANVLRCVTPGGRVHPQFQPFQSTGRWSVSEPGLTVLKKGVADSERMFLTADGEEDDPDGDVLVSIDADQIDIRGMAAHSQDPALIALLNDPSRDFHQEIGDMSGVARKFAKTLDLGWLYGRSARGMAENTPGVTMDAANAVTGYMANAFPGVVAYQRQVRQQGEAGLLLDNGFGRRLRVDPMRAHTQAPAMIGQSTTREIIAECLLDLARTAPDVLRMVRVIVHDEIVASVPRRQAEEVARIIQSCMSRQWAPPGGSVPVNITAGQGKPFVFAYRWGSLYM